MTGYNGDQGYKLGTNINTSKAMCTLWHWCCAPLPPAVGGRGRLCCGQRMEGSGRANLTSGASKMAQSLAVPHAHTVSVHVPPFTSKAIIVGYMLNDGWVVVLFLTFVMDCV